MLKDILQSKEVKIQERVEKHLKAGAQQLAQKMYNGAMVEFGKAMELDFEGVYPKLMEELDKAASSGELEAALAVGLNMLKHKKDDCELANKLGNYARRNGDFKQAKALYQTALKIDKNFALAFYNLAAAEVKSELYDDKAMNAINQFRNIKGYVIPGYMNNTDPVESMTESARRSKAQVSKKKIQELMLKRDQATEEGGLPQARALDQEIEKIKLAAEKIDESDICNEFKRQMSNDADNRIKHCYNLAIYAIEKGKADVAKEALQHLDEKTIPTKGLLQALVLDQKGQRKEAIELLIQFLGENEFNRYYNVNLGLIYRKAKNSFLSVKYLIKTADLLRKSNGIYNMYELLNQANQLYKQDKLKQALEFFIIASSEIKDPDLWIKMGTIYKEQELIEEAIYAFREVLKIDPESEAGKAELQKIHDAFVSEGDSLMVEKKYHPAVEQYEKALSVFRVPETLKKASSAYRQLNSIKKSNMLLEEAEGILNAEKEKEQDRMRTALIIKAKMMLKQQKYQQAIEFLETAFEMKLDKNVYAQLTMLYKKFKGKDSLSGLEKRWNDMLIAKERAVAEAKRLEREQQEAENANPES